MHRLIAYGDRKKKFNFFPKNLRKMKFLGYLEGMGHNTQRIKPFEELTFHDDFMFGVVMQDKAICREALECMLGIKIGRIEYAEPQYSADPFYTAHGIRLDVYVQDGSRIYDVEIQNRDFQDLGRRTRYYQGMMDTDSLLRGEPYSKLKDSIIIFLCRFDPFKKGIPCYTVKRTCLQDSAVKINDGALVQVFNCEAFGQVKNPKLRAFLKYIQTGSVETDFTRRLEKMVEAKKQIEEMKKAYLSWSLHDHDVRMEGRIEGIAIGEKRGRSEGATERAREDARNMLADKLPYDKIAQYTGLSIAEVEQLAAQG